MRRTRFLTALALLVLAASSATASQQGVIVIQKWRAMDMCTKQAQAAFPDFTPDSNAKRDARLQACLAGQNLPPREVLAPHP